MEGIKVFAFDTGGTVLDWHAGLSGDGGVGYRARHRTRLECASERASPPLAVPDE